MIASGAFAHTSEARDCTFCDFKRACGMPHEVEQVAEKAEDTKLVDRKRLAAHE